MGATSASDIIQVRRLCPMITLLVPGIGAQGGDLQATVKHGINERGRGIIINVSRSILYASNDPLKFADESRRIALQIRRDINEILNLLGVNW